MDAALLPGEPVAFRGEFTSTVSEALGELGSLGHLGAPGPEVESNFEEFNTGVADGEEDLDSFTENLSSLAACEAARVGTSQWIHGELFALLGPDQESAFFVVQVVRPDLFPVLPAQLFGFGR